MIAPCLRETAVRGSDAGVGCFSHGKDLYQGREKRNNPGYRTMKKSSNYLHIFPERLRGSTPGFTLSIGVADVTSLRHGIPTSLFGNGEDVTARHSFQVFQFLSLSTGGWLMTCQ